MKIIIHSIEELLQLTELIRPPQTINVTNTLDEADAIRSILRHESGKVTEHLRGTMLVSAETARQMGRVEPDGLPDDIDAPQAVVAQAAAKDAARTDAIAAGKFEDTGPSLPEVAALAPDVDSTGRRWDGRIDSSNKALNTNGSWRARRNHGYTPEEVEAIKAEVLAEQAVVEADEPVATETHALPQVEPETAGDTPDVQVEPETAGQAAPAQVASTVDLQALVAASQEAAMDAKDGLQDLLAGCRDFTSAHGTAEFNALKAAVAPRGDTGASLQEFTPAERRLMLACIANYPQKEA